jgi:competence protein ComEA
MSGFTKPQQTIFLAVGLTVLVANFLRPFPLPFSFYSIPELEPHQQWIIEIIGSVRRPGIYTFNNSPTTSQAIQSAGGMLANRFIALEGEPGNLQSGMSIETKTSAHTTTKLLLSPMDVRKNLVLGIPIDVNRAEVEDLVLIPGISQRLAQRIVEFREFRGTFKTWHDLRRVKGVGPVNIQRFRNYFSLQ